MQIRKGLCTTTRLELLHDEIRLDAQQQGLTRVGTTSRGPSLQGLRLN